MKKDLGVFEFGYQRVRVFATDLFDGGYFRWLPEDEESLPEIHISVDYDIKNAPGDLLAPLMHEAIEYLSSCCGCRLEPSTTVNRCHDKYTFYMTHPQFSEIIASAAEGIARVWPKLRKECKRYNERKKKR